MSVPLSALNTRSMFGDQTLSKRASAPNYGFGSSTREKQSKQAAQAYEQCIALAQTRKISAKNVRVGLI